MNGNVYESCALVLRYAFVLAGAFILVRSAFMTLMDTRRAKVIRSTEAETGVLAHFSLSGEKVPNERYPLYKEGTVGSGRASDLKISGAGLEKKHFYYEIYDGAIEITPLDGAAVFFEGEEITDFLSLRPGGTFRCGRAQFKYIVNRIPVKPVSPTTRRLYGGILSKIVEKK